MISILLADYFILKSDFSEKKIKVSRVIIWLTGFIIYRLLMLTDLISGCTIPDMLITFVITVITGLIIKKEDN